MNIFKAAACRPRQAYSGSPTFIQEHQHPMSPKRNTRPTVSTPDAPHATRDRETQTSPASPVRTEGADQAPVSPPGRQTEPAEPPLPTIRLSEITTQVLTGDGSVSVSLDNYYLPPELVPLLSEPDANSGIRTFRTRTYVELAEGGTVLLGRDAQDHYRARSSAELIASGPRLEQVEGSLLWRRIPQPVVTDGSDSTLTITLHTLPEEDSTEVSTPKRPRLSEPQGAAPGDGTSVFSKNWGVEPRFMPEFITINGVHYKVVTRVDAREFPITYIQHPTHAAYDFDVMEATLRHTPDEQPRSAIRVPPHDHWEIDPRLPFEKPLTAYVRDAFPEVTTVTLGNIARKQFELANNSTFADAAGLTALRQIFHSWKNGTPSPHPEWTDPLLMLPILPTSSGATSASRAIDLPVPSATGALDRLDFDPLWFQREWNFFTSTYSPMDLKRFMAGLLTRNGYTVMEPNTFNSFPALVFRRTGHDYVFFMSLHRTRIPKLSLPTHMNPNTTGINLETQVGEAAAQVVKDAHQANKIVWLKGGSQIRPNFADTVFIIRDDNARL
ncbi:MULTISPECIES: hypothetical protein [Pseudomonas]|uniref:hypothetical protein n=1 Tax=Pseudomonas TaxID=286 RepID=UPI001BE77C8A|nr:MULTISPECIES: hypothetical protein [Pseudomonas]MBT2340539.1 hypothetical protein [Pseudomonas fluorescens]MCD4530747.1 hypothetical protein [Pseudomonas sp. C3-2018]